MTVRLGDRKLVRWITSGASIFSCTTAESCLASARIQARPPLLSRFNGQMVSPKRLTASLPSAITRWWSPPVQRRLPFRNVAFDTRNRFTVGHVVAVGIHPRQALQPSFGNKLSERDLVFWITLQERLHVTYQVEDKAVFLSEVSRRGQYAGSTARVTPLARL